MKTVLVTTCWVDNPLYLQKTKKWVKYYAKSKLEYDNIVLLDNASSFSSLVELSDHLPHWAIIQRFTEHLPRRGHLEYPYLWRAIDFFKELLKEYDKIVYTDNDFYITSDKLAEHINKLEDTWWSPWCNKYGFPETGVQVVTRNNKNFLDFTRNSTLIHDGKTMEVTLPVTVDRSWIGDRYGEFEIKPDPKTVDFWAQAMLDDKL